MTLKKSKMSLLLLCVGIVTTQFYQNCAPMQMNEFASLSVTEGHDMGSGSGAHPIDEQKVLPSQKQLVVNKEVVAALMRDIFTSKEYPVTNLERLIWTWVYYKGAQYGGSCNYYLSHSGRDCDGSSGNTNTSYHVESNTIRESFHIQICENILGLDNGVHAALQKVSLVSTSPVNSANVTNVYGLFYRGTSITTAELGTLLDLDKTLAEQKAAPLERWRAILSQVCESPGWQLF